MLAKASESHVQAVRVVDVPSDFDPSASHILLERVGYRNYRLSGLIDHPDITAPVRLPQSVLASREVAIEAATDLARRLKLRVIYIDAQFLPPHRP